MQRTLVAALALCSAALLVGCEDEPEPKFEPTESAQTSETTTEPTEAETTDAGPVVPELPDEATEPTKAGAEAFVEYYWEVVSYSVMTGDLQQLADLSAETCEGCLGGIGFIRTIYKKGGSIDAGPYRLLRIDDTWFDDGEFIAFEGTAVTRSTLHVIRIPGRKTQRLEPVTEHDRMTLNFVDGAWRVDILEVL